MLQVREKVSVLSCTYHHHFLTAGSTVDKEGSRADKAGSRADEGRGDYQERAAAESGDETESGSSVCGVVCVVTRGPPDCRRLSWKNS